ncbi:hypothetical protein ACP4OV_003660 [Aristida adscensionis]
MGGWKDRPWQGRRHHDRGGRRRPSSPPLPPPYDGNNYCSVPLWEREFCSYVGNISWKRFCENKQYVSIFNNLEHWDDSAAFENFQNAKARFWANYHGQPSDIPLPDPDMYIDKIDDHCKVEPELVADLDKVQLPFDSDNNLSPAAGSSNTESKYTQNPYGNWGIYVEKPGEVNKWEDKPGSNYGWGLNNESSNKWGDSSTSGWGNAPANPSWRRSSNNHYPSNNWNSFHGGSKNRYQEPSNIPGRKKDRGGYQQRNWKQRNQAEDLNQSHTGRGKHSEWRPLHKARGNVQGIEGGF